MHESRLAAIALTAILVLSLVAFRLLWGDSQLAAASGLGRLPGLPQGWRRWLHGERHASRTPRNEDR